MSSMTKEQIESVLDRVRTWPNSRQEDAVQVLLAMEEQEAGIYKLSDEERADIREALDEISDGQVASEKEIEAVFRRFHR
jgi:hypothetical protein